METSLSLQQFKTLALQYQKAKKKAKLDCNNYIQERSWKIKRRCKYLKNTIGRINP